MSDADAQRPDAMQHASLAGPERRALRWALRDDGDRPLSADCCRAAAVLARLTPGDLEDAP